MAFDDVQQVLLPVFGIRIRSACFWASRIRSISQSYGSGSFPFLTKVLSRLK